MGKKQGRPKKYEALEHINITLEAEEKIKLDNICDNLSLSRHEYLSACLSCDDDHSEVNSADIKEKEAEVLSLKGKLDLKHRDVQRLEKTIKELKEKLEHKEDKLSIKKAKIKMKIEDLRKKCERRINTCKDSVGIFGYNRGKRDAYHSGIMSELGKEYNLLKTTEGITDEDLDRELEEWL